ncbi:MAG: hypothetical protein LQ346_003056 [Caloplaca aetnensis]|nr:MAG: hypothetical protein LQ346_003056 [Caloplaca aetnensis]
MATLRQTFAPRKISQLYADTKRTYEHMIQHNITNIPQTATHSKLKIQKDRLIAWGLEWADSNVARDGDIDDSLDRAGISDLVASIMSSIQDLLERADSIQPQRTVSFPAAFPHDKPTLAARQNLHWTSQDLEGLSDIVKDLTVSIDTLCDLSRSRQALSRARQLELSTPKLGLPSRQSNVEKRGGSHHDTSLLHATRVDEKLLQIPSDDKAPAPSSSPPSYESVAAGSEDRVLAFADSYNLFAYGEKVEKSHRSLLLEYLPVIDAISSGQHQPSAERYDELMQVQPTTLAGLGPTYLGTLTLRGWIEDSHRGRTALVYEIPLPNVDPSQGSRKLKVATLLSFLYHGADTDSTNMPSLEDRFRLAFNLASSLLHLHAKKVFHRNINSRNVIFFRNDETELSGSDKPWKKGIIRRPFLTSFDQPSEDHGEVDESFISNIYRHPSYERGQRSRFKAVYDIYSLGLILLEIGLWMPISKLWKTRYTRAQFKNRLQTIYTKKLSGKCGTKYMKVVEFCLRSADPESTTGNLDNSKSGDVDSLTASQNSLYWKGFKVLERCCMIDDTEEDYATNESVQDLTTAEREGLTSQAPAESKGQHPATQKTAEQAVQAPLERASSMQVQENQAGEAARIPPSDELAENPQPAKKPEHKCKVWSYEIPTDCKSHWQLVMKPKLRLMFSKCIDRWESYSIQTLMAGETPEDARPTIYMVCASIAKARKVLQYVNQDRNLFDIKVTRGEILRSMAAKKKKKKRGKGKTGPSTMPSTTENSDKVQQGRNHYQERPSCGASIGAYLDEQHLPPVSFGGTVLVNGEPYGMSVHHMLENDEIDYGLDDLDGMQRSMVPRGGGGMCLHPDEDENGKHEMQESPPEALYPFEISDDEDEGYRSGEDEEDLSDFDPAQWDTPDIEDLTDIDVNMGDTPGITPGNGETVLVTQPAIDDVHDDFFPNGEDMDEDHLASHTFGHIHASSGIRRTSRGAISHEIDWALIKIREHRRAHSNDNTIRGGSRHCPTEKPGGVVKATQLGGLKVHSLGRTSGLQTGTILPDMVTVKLPGRISDSDSWAVAGNFGIGGDSGAWVIDNATGEACAHVLAWWAGLAYVAPMEVLFEDMARTLSADVALPGQKQPITAKCEASNFRGGAGVDTPCRCSDPMPPITEDETMSRHRSQGQAEKAATAPTLSREPTSSPPVATSPPIQRGSIGHIEVAQQLLGDTDPPLSPRQAPYLVPATFVSESRRKSGSEMLIEKGEESFKANCRMSIG